MTQPRGPRLRLEFWRGFKEHMRSDPAVTCGRASSETWMHHDGELNCGRLFSMIRVRTGEIGSQYALDDHTAATVYSFLRAHREDVDRHFAQDVTWRVVSERMHEVEVRRAAALERRDEWPELFRWLAGNLHAFQSALGPFVGRSTPLDHRGDWDEVSFFEALTLHNAPAVPPARRILEWADAAMPLVYWGHGRREGSFVPAVRRLGTEHSVVSVWTTGLFFIRFAALKKEPPFDDDTLRLELLARLNRVPHVDLPPPVIDKYPGLPLALLNEPGALDAFVDALDGAVGALKS